MADVDLTPDLVEDVLEGLGLRAAPEPDLEGLRAVYRCWCERVPFDNVAKRIHLAEGRPGPLPGDAPAEFFRAWLADGTGATCWAGNGALCALLAALGFDARRGIGTMMVAPELPPNHGTVSVDVDGARYLVDASMLHVEPLALDGASGRVTHPAAGVERRLEGGAHLVRWRPLHAEWIDCRIDSLESDAAEFRRRHEETRSWGPFNYSLSARLVGADGSVIGAGLGRYAGITAEGESWSRAFEPGERMRLLVDELGVREAVAARLPADEPLPPPPGRSA